MFGMGPQEILIVLVVALIFIGPKRLPEIAKVLGKGFGELRRALDDVKGQVDIENILRDQEDRDQEEEPPERDMNTSLQESFLGGSVAHTAPEESKSADEQEKEKAPEKTEN